MKHIILILFCILLASKAMAITEVPPQKPTLIINIVLDNISNEEIDRYSHLLSDKGLLKLKNEGTSLNSAFYPYASNNRACDYASISTGASPRYHGIVSDKWYTRHNNEYESAIANNKTVVLDSKIQKHGFDASNIVATTIGDELKLSSVGKSKVYSVSLDNMASVLLAGHAADGAYWLDNVTGRWVSSSAYMKELPEWVKQFNGKNFSDFYLEQQWVLSKNINEQTIDEEIYRRRLFPITLKHHIVEETPYSVISSTPMGQLYVEDFATDIIKNEHLGQDQYTDLLYINFSSITDPHMQTGKYSIEKADFVVRLDKTIAKLLTFLDKEIGTHRYLIALTSTKQVGLSVEALSEQGLPTGLFDPVRAQALLNSYLMAIHGQGKWVLNIHNQQIYLNKKLIEKSHLNLDIFEEQVASFMEEFSGIKWALPAFKLKYADFKDESFMAMQESYFPSRCGDVMLSYFPGWAEKTTEYSVDFTYSHNNAVVPMYFYGWKTQRSTINSKVYITGLAPTLSTILNISIPNSSSENLIFEELKNE